MKALLLSICLALVGCASSPKAIVEAHCADVCFVPCVGEDGDTGIRWDRTPVAVGDWTRLNPLPSPPFADDSAAWDALAGEVVPALADKLRQCEVARSACDTCLRRLEREEVIAL